jgi:hypothetical protein
MCPEASSRVCHDSGQKKIKGFIDIPGTADI